MKDGILTVKIVGRKSKVPPHKKIGSGLSEYFEEDGKRYVRIFRKDGKIVRLLLPDVSVKGT